MSIHWLSVSAGTDVILLSDRWGKEWIQRKSALSVWIKLLLKSLIICDIVQHEWMVCSWCFETVFWSHLQGSGCPRKMLEQVDAWIYRGSGGVAAHDWLTGRVWGAIHRTVRRCILCFPMWTGLSERQLNWRSITFTWRGRMAWC